MKSCHRCGGEIPALAKIARTDGCPSCHSDLKVCLNCALYDPGANNQCREPQAEWQTDKDKANFCEFFELRETAALLGSAPAGRESARAALDALFRKS